jgi:hypothetical protein
MFKDNFEGALRPRGSLPEVFFAYNIKHDDNKDQLYNTGLIEAPIQNIE